MQPEPRKRLSFDPTINAGHILTFVAMVIGVMSSYALLDKRIGVLEEKATTAVVQATDRTLEQKDALREIKSDIKDLQRSVNEIGRAVSAGSKK
ncbi:MAG: hypothetical protein JWR07_1895 [Nevskia sp.]|nr:hypothetical protein [Nevskia sp.]